MKLDRVAQWAEVLANIGVIVSLVLLVVEVQDNTDTLRIQASQQRAAALNSPMLANPRLAQILSEIKSVDGAELLVQAFMDRYDLTYADAVVWVRYLSELWTGMETEHAQLGPSEGLENRIRQLLAFPDEVLWIDSGGADWFLGREFRVYLQSIRVGA